MPVPWPLETPPTGWLKCNGAAFSSEKYPNLAKVYPTNKLPDLRGEFIRGWDDGRGIDSGRNLLSAQNDAIQNIVGSFGRTQLFRDVLREGANKRGNSSRLTQSFHFFMFEPIFSPVNALNQPI
ncbi:tail fiber protein [Escherichia coli]|nr:tail fiber protein [Escherichia coli]